jgi:hypothetical protein
MNNKWTIILSLVILACTSVTSAKKETTYTVNSPIMKMISEWVDKDTIVFIDLDDSLTIPKSLMFSQNANPYRSFINDMVILGQKMPSYNLAVAKWYQQREIKLVEDSWPEYIEKLQRKGATVYGLCKMPMHLLNIEKKRYQEIRALNVNFNNLVNDQESLVIEQQENWFSFFYEGIIFTGPYSRSHTVLEFLKVTNIIPSKLVFISNSKPDLDRLDQDLRVFAMKFYDVLYLGAENIPGKPDRELVKFQQQALIKNGRWMEDDVAKTALQQYKQGQGASPK